MNVAINEGGEGGGAEARQKEIQSEFLSCCFD